MKFILSLIIILNCCLVFCYGQNSTFVLPEKVVRKWNSMTIKSLEKQSEKCLNDKKIAEYLNRLQWFSEYQRNTPNDSIQNSNRYIFLKKIDNELNGVKEFYCIEANEMGVKILIRNFIVYKGSTDNLRVLFFIYFDKKWRLKGKCSIKNMQFKELAHIHKAESGTGSNPDDIIISQFKNNHIIGSDYILNGTLS